MPRLFPLGRICQVPLSDIRSTLLQAFQKWGLPKAIRTDNGDPLGVPSRDAVPIFSLWFIAWGIEHILNSPRRPQQNAQVERNQGTAANWAEVNNCPDRQTLQNRLDYVADIQRNHYQVRKIGNVPRSTLFNDLMQIKRPFVPDAFDEKKAYEYLAKAVYPRKVSSIGSISIHSKPFQAGWQYRNQLVFVKFNPQQVAWTILDDSQNIIKVIPDQRFSKENLFNLTVFQ